MKSTREQTCLHFLMHKSLSITDYFAVSTENNEEPREGYSVIYNITKLNYYLGLYTVSAGSKCV